MRSHGPADAATAPREGRGTPSRGILRDTAWYLEQYGAADMPRSAVQLTGERHYDHEADGARVLLRRGELLVGVRGSSIDAEALAQGAQIRGPPTVQVHEMVGNLAVAVARSCTIASR